jgi:acetyltransferase-like isoleucine patch superfamily enzyme
MSVDHMSNGMMSVKHMSKGIPSEFYPRTWSEKPYEVIDREGRGGKLILGQGSKIARRTSIDVTCDVIIGNGCMISEEVIILTHDHSVNDVFNKELIKGWPLEIEDNVFIGTRAIILPNVTKIGKNAFIGAGSVVTKDVPANMIVAGNPAKIIRSK